MNYLHQIKHFWLIHEAEILSVFETALYFYLLESSNKCLWRNPFKRSNAKIQADLCIKSYDKLSDCRKRLREVGLIDFETQNGDANVVYKLLDLSIVSKGREGGLPEGSAGGFSEVCRKVLPELSKVKTKALNTNQKEEKDCLSADSLALYQKFQIFFNEQPNDLATMLKPTQIQSKNRADIDAIVAKFCNWYATQNRISPDFEKNKAALARWFCNEKVFHNENKPSAAMPKKSNEDQWRENGLYD